MCRSLLSAATLALLINCASSLTIVGYFADNNVTQHLRLDRDQTALNTAAQKYDFDAAYAAYSKGNTSHSNPMHYMTCQKAPCYARTVCGVYLQVTRLSDLMIVNDYRQLKAATVARSMAPSAP